MATSLSLNLRSSLGFAVLVALLLASGAPRRACAQDSSCTGDPCRRATLQGLDREKKQLVLEGRPEHYGRRFRSGLSLIIVGGAAFVAGANIAFLSMGDDEPSIDTGAIVGFAMMPAGAVLAVTGGVLLRLARRENRNQAQIERIDDEMRRLKHELDRPRANLSLTPAFALDGRHGWGLRLGGRF